MVFSQTLKEAETSVSQQFSSAKNQPVDHLNDYLYVCIINDLGSDRVKIASNQLFEVRLKPAALPKIDETLLMSGQQAKGSSNAATTQSVNTSTTVTTTVTQRDAQGNVVNVRQSQSNQQNNSSTPEKIRENSDSSGRG